MAISDLLIADFSLPIFSALAKHYYRQANRLWSVSVFITDHPSVANGDLIVGLKKGFV
jgi:hypothetical protein